MATASYPLHAPPPSAAVTIDAPASELLKPGWREFALLLFTILLYAIAGLGGGDFMRVMNYVGPTLLMLALAIGSIGMIRVGVVAIWTPLFWARLSLIAYCGVGSLVPLLANDDTKNLIEGFYLFFPTDVAKYNLVVCVFATTLLTMVWLILHATERVGRGRRTDRQSWMPQASGLSLKVMGFIFLGVGTVVSYLLVLPVTFGFYTGVFPNTIVQLAYAAQIGYFLLVYWSIKNRSRLFLLILALALLDSVIGLLSFSKYNAIFPLVMVALGYVYASPKLSRFVLLSAFVVGYYFAIVPVVTHGRDTITASYGDFATATFAERVNVIAGYRSGATASTDDTQVGWVRLSYVNAGTFAINQFDLGLPGNSLRHILVVLIPRAIYPDKPIITDIGREFNIAVTGNPNSQSSPGMPAESYWNFGWPGVALVSLILGTILTFWSLYAVKVMQAGAWHLLFVVLMGIRVGSRMDGMLVSDVIGPIGFVIIAHIALTFLNRLTAERKVRRSA